VDSNECEGQVVARSYTPAGTNRIVITSPPLGIMFPDEPGPCPGLCASLKPTTKQATRATGKPANMPQGINFISSEEVTTF
jgi:hypothetical protein